MTDTDLTLAYFPFFAGDWLSSTSVALMSPEVEGTYIRLLAHQWRNGWLPADPKDIQLLTKRTPQQWRREWLILQQHFPATEADGLRRNKRLESERVTSIGKHEQRIQAGQRSAAKRQQNGNASTNETATTVATLVPTEPPTNDQRSLQRDGQRNVNNHNHSHNHKLPQILPDGSTKPPSVEPPPMALPPRTAPPPDPTMLAELRSAALPHEALALEVLMANSPSPFAVVGEVYACGSGMNTLRGKQSGNMVEIEHVMRAVSEMAANGQPWSVRLFRGYAQSCADRPPQTASAEEREAAKRTAEIEKFAAKTPVMGVRDDAGRIVSVPILVQESPEDRAERDRIRKESMANFRKMARGEMARDPANVWPEKYTPDASAA